MGFYSINLSKKILKYTALNQLSFNQLKANKIINNIKNIKLYNLALSNKKEITMWVLDKDKTSCNLR